MKTKIFIALLMLSITSFFIACSSNNKDEPIVQDEVIKEVIVETIEDITLNAGGSSTCTNKTSFTVVPSDNPIVTFSTNASSGDTTITLSDTTQGFVTISNCSVKN